MTQSNIPTAPGFPFDAGAYFESLQPTQAGPPPTPGDDEATQGLMRVAETNSDGKEAFDRQMDIYDMDSLIRDCQIRPREDPLEQSRRMAELAKKREDMVAVLDALCGKRATAADSASNAPDQKEQRQDSRLQACIDAGLPMNTKTALLRLPDGVGAVADKLGLTRQAFSADVKAALQRRATAKRDGDRA